MMNDDRQKAEDMLAAHISEAVEGMFGLACNSSLTTSQRLSSIRTLVRLGNKIPWDHKPQAVRDMKGFLGNVAKDLTLSERTRASAKKLLDILMVLTP
jgi:hypothetical protein